MNESEGVDLPGIQIRAATRGDLSRLTEIYNYYVVHTPITFDVTPWALEQRISWFEQFGKTGRYRLLVAEKDSLVVGYAGTTRFRPKAAYDTTVETTIYCAPEFIGKGLGTQLYAALFCDSIRRKHSSYRRRIRASQPDFGSTARPLRIQSSWSLFRKRL
jgi:L-amino acid N-acyltransferase YncA